MTDLTLHASPPTPRTLRLIAPSGWCQHAEAAARGIARLEDAGHRIEQREVVARRWLRFAGEDAERLADLNGLAHGPLPDIALAVRGGYGASRLLADIDYPALRARLRHRPVILCGHSDFTAVQLALLRHSQLVTFSGPMLAGNFGAEVRSAFTERHFWQLIAQPETTLRWTTSADALSVEGQLWGGNLAMIASLVGTRWLPPVSAGILVIEDVNEHPFRVERMLLQLLDAGVLSQQRAIVAGSFSGGALTAYDNGYSLDNVWQTISRRSGVPVVPGLAFGHEADTVTLPLGAQAALWVSAGEAQLALSGYPWLR
ncbi:muramoyltetrapeptide carboxypeptidase [Pantoea sp. 1.19]|uniref:muramoyltetrapeptide carboxypeptidase n=1 Tax=Pantoea sp. 1.19 TaxID=1925589 RepID=UPI000948E23E|nr:muramoyltetrapeptide carboxypeptidase [Pantoea sp. 1.19]